jgi:DNA-binding response OmpR family regulator
MTAVESPCSLAGSRILVVEDDYFIAQEICMALQSDGASIVGPAPDLRSSLELIEREEIDCAVLDINLHGEYTFELARQLRKRGTPSVLATGFDDAILPLQLNQTLRFTKPVDLDALLRTVRSICQQRRREPS